MVAAMGLLRPMFSNDTARQQAMPRDWKDCSPMKVNQEGGGGAGEKKSGQSKRGAGEADGEVKGAEGHPFGERRKHQAAEDAGDQAAEAAGPTDEAGRGVEVGADAAEENRESEAAAGSQELGERDEDGRAAEEREQVGGEGANALGGEAAVGSWGGDPGEIRSGSRTGRAREEAAAGGGEGQHDGGAAGGGGDFQDEPMPHGEHADGQQDGGQEGEGGGLPSAAEPDVEDGTEQKDVEDGRDDEGGGGGDGGFGEVAGGEGLGQREHEEAGVEAGAEAGRSEEPDGREVLVARGRLRHQAVW